MDCENRRGADWEKPSTISHSIDSSYNNININLGSRKREIKAFDKNSAKALTQLQKTARTIIKFTVPQKAASPARTFVEIPKKPESKEDQLKGKFMQPRI